MLRWFSWLLAAPLALAYEDFDLECNETVSLAMLRGQGSESYKGCANKTWSGNDCQAWDVQSPQKHKNNKPHLHHNYCRNPDGEPHLWCYTVEPKIRWEYCDPLTPDFQETVCERGVCKPYFDAIKAAGLWDECALTRNIGALSLSTCCPYMQPLGMCTVNHCYSEEMLGTFDQDLDLAFHFRLMGQACSCYSECRDSVNLLHDALALNEDLLMVTLQVHELKQDHPLMKLVCSPSGWSCLRSSSTCQQLKDLQGGVSKNTYRGSDIANAVLTTGTFEVMYCPATTTTTCPTCTTVTTSTWNSSFGVNPYVSSLTRKPTTTRFTTAMTSTTTTIGLVAENPVANGVHQAPASKKFAGVAAWVTIMAVRGR